MGRAAAAMPGEYEQLAPIASMAPAGTSRRAVYAKCALMATIATAVVVGSVLVMADRHEAVSDGSELGGAYYAVTKPPAFNFNRFISNAWFYSGRSSDGNEEGFIEKLARRHHYKLQIHHLESFKDNEFRAALFSENIHCIVFPPLTHFPGISELAKKAEACPWLSWQETPAESFALCDIEPNFF